jgi:Holliday junction resolvase
VIKNERQLWEKLKDETPSTSWIRIENWALPGTPDLLGYNVNGTFFTVELKHTKVYSVRLSPHQISFHVRHKKNTFILVSCSDKLGNFRLYPGSLILELNYAGLKLDPLVQGLRACALKLESL